MGHVVLAFILSLLVGISSAVALERTFSEGYLGEKLGTTTYSGPWQPVFHHDAYFGKTTSDDEHFWGGYFYPYLWRGAAEWSSFFSDEMLGASTCPHPVLSKNFDDIRYGHRLLALSYLLELMDTMRADMDLLKKPTTCRFDLQEILKSCKPKTLDMKTFITNLSVQKPYAAPVIGKEHNYLTFQSQWLAKLAKANAGISANRLQQMCKKKKLDCAGLGMEKAQELMEEACVDDRKLFTEICSEDDQLYGNSSVPLATYLLGTSNLVTLINDEGHAQGCLRRFGQMMATKERLYPALVGAQPLIFAQLKEKYGERYPHGRAFVYGALKEFTKKGLTSVFEAKVEEPKPAQVVVAAPKVEVKKEEKPVVAAAPVVAAVEPKVEVKKEVAQEIKSAFLQAAEIRSQDSLDRVDVDMLKFRYDYVFSMAELQLLSDSLKDYIKREALEEMRSWDKLGTKEAPVPLTFIKYMIDSQNHQGLYNLVGVLSDKFWVLNDIDEKYKPAPEFIEFRNDASTSNAWQIFILRPE